MVQELFERFLARVPEPLARSTDSWSQLEAARGEDARPVRGPFGLEWFWLLPKGGSETPGPETAEGLGVFQLQRSGGKTVAQLRHFSVVKLELFKEGLCCLKNLMFARLPAASIRMVLWCQEQGEDGKVMANSQVEAILKELCFRWFRFENKRGLRGKEMQRPRGEEDPEMPLEVPSLEFCIGQVWLRGASSQSKPVPYSGNLALAAGCLRALKGKDDHDAPPPESLLDSVAAAAWATCKQSLQNAAFSGALDALLSELRPLRLEAPKEGKDAGVRSSVALTRCLVKQMEEGVELPEAICQAVNESPELVRRGLSQAALQQAAMGLQTEKLPDLVTQMKAKDGCFGRLVMTLEWQEVRMIDEQFFEVPVTAAAQCAGHPHPLLYLSTSEEGIFVVLVPWQGLAMKDEDLFASCTYLLRDAVPLEEAPSSVTLWNFDARRAVRACNVDGVPLEMDGKLHVLEFESLAVSSGRIMPGKLSQEAIDSSSSFPLQRPFALCLWHNDMDELNAPLSVTMVH